MKFVQRLHVRLMARHEKLGQIRGSQCRQRREQQGGEECEDVLHGYFQHDAAGSSGPGEAGPIRPRGGTADPKRGRGVQEQEQELGAEGVLDGRHDGKGRELHWRLVRG